ncbi:YcxB family protein [Candidatus Kaistella beijingensis]|uniref:YcxB family protein n=1 Tax=Candidatus Kaistella beijingensis TaxID=2820270 RepID=UPI001CC6D817|nr:YcxB family protein [Candidatus Kaistella beijingensis]UBB89989.1 YcxB family protein [Candidatus Kaistella beijingensis]
MELNYSLDENDFLEYQLYTASKSKNIRNQRRRNLIIMIVIFLAFFISIYNSTKSFPIIPLLIYIALIIAYKIYETYRYKNHYKKFINENYKERFGLMCKLNFAENQIIEESKLGESKINFESLTEINETKNYYFLKLLTSQSLIIPKKVIQNIQQFNSMLNEIKSKYNLKENIDLDWKWK